MKPQKIKIELDEWDSSCSDGCCLSFGTTIKVDGVQLDSTNQDAGTIVREILEHLGYEVELVETYNGE